MVKAFHEDGVEERNKASKAKQDQCEMWTKLQALSWDRSLVWHKVYSGINEHFHHLLSGLAWFFNSLSALFSTPLFTTITTTTTTFFFFFFSFFYLFINFFSFNHAKIKELLLFIGMNSLETWVHFLKIYRQMSSINILLLLL